MTVHIDLPEIRAAAEQDIKITDIDIPEDRARSFDPEEAAALAAIIATQGMLHPVRVRMVGNRYSLVAGLRRLEAARLNGWERVRSTISNAASDDEARLEEVMENLARAELSALDRCHHLYDLKQAYERLHPDAKNGGDRRSETRTQKLRSDPADHAAPEIFSFAAHTAEKIGLSRRSIETAVKIWKDLSVASRARCVGTWLAGHQTNLRALSEQTHPIQKNVLDLLFSDPPKANNVQEALTVIENGRAPTHVEKKFNGVNKALAALKDGELDAVLATNQDRLLERVSRMEQGIATLTKIFADMKDDELDQIVAANEARIVASLKRRGAI
ncbi:MULTISPECIES: ParB N-terminal domain-containing protein [unclassified Ensifer]|uniref:ParB/RepB/Spo0J family partition protein n=1 Tax=unclassified Ensifer TaxID=2633371 RepID=UPI000813B59A|nr:MULTISPECIES: ParB N-terminal domain-containing protein [unclassified Ensifer]OCP17401.1 chromosome partitioning protein ParB [Ensifer sp. LC54]OCP28693.1 chromosome partitioning protein ParB [Ensifer sp. LC384]